MYRDREVALKPTAGWTLPELALVLAIAAIVLSTAIPALQGLVFDGRRTSRVNAFAHAVHLAKNEAIKRRRFVALCKTLDGLQCGDSAVTWADGWLVFVNEDNDRPVRVDPGEAILYRHPAVESGTITGNRNAFSFTPDYRRSTNGTLTFCDRRGPGKARAVIVSYTGRPRASALDSRDRPLVCP